MIFTSMTTTGIGVCILFAHLANAVRTTQNDMMQFSRSHAAKEQAAFGGLTVDHLESYASGNNNLAGFPSHSSGPPPLLPATPSRDLSVHHTPPIPPTPSTYSSEGAFEDCVGQSTETQAIGLLRTSKKDINAYVLSGANDVSLEDKENNDVVKKHAKADSKTFEEDAKEKFATLTAEINDLACLAMKRSMKDGLAEKPVRKKKGKKDEEKEASSEKCTMQELKEMLAELAKELNDLALQALTRAVQDSFRSDAKKAQDQEDEDAADEAPRQQASTALPGIDAIPFLRGTRVGKMMDKAAKAWRTAFEGFGIFNQDPRSAAQDDSERIEVLEEPRSAAQDDDERIKVLEASDADSYGETDDFEFAFGTRRGTKTDGTETQGGLSVNRASHLTDQGVDEEALLRQDQGVDEEALLRQALKQALMAYETLMQSSSLKSNWLVAKDQHVADDASPTEAPMDADETRRLRELNMRHSKEMHALKAENAALEALKRAVEAYLELHS